MDWACGNFNQRIIAAGKRHVRVYVVTRGFQDWLTLMVYSHCPTPRPIKRIENCVEVFILNRYRHKHGFLLCSVLIYQYLCWPQSLYLSRCRAVWTHHKSWVNMKNQGSFCWCQWTYCIFQIIYAAQALSNYPTSKIAKENFDVFADSWSQQINDLSILVKDINDICQGKQGTKQVYLSLPRPGVSSISFCGWMHIRIHTGYNRI